MTVHISFSLFFIFCLQYILNIYPSATFQGSAKPNAIAYAIGVVAIFVTILATVTIFDGAVHRRHQRLVAQLRRVNALLAGLFPKV